ncbi:Pol polyprotein [Plakobranchus ocellatus]|uniref:Pol polyprotein n=1 Tax=Plakobranchus ocellatus TaxID=259542 RepID=A0AAV4CAN0_9GAST|nr:Pol polyprotein [Plakobranchus ocellatus]
MQILSDIFLNRNLSGETSFQYQYVMDLHNRIRKGWRLAQDSVRDSVDESRLRHEPKSKLKHFVPGDEVLVLLPSSDNKLVLSFKRPNKVIEKHTSVVYLVDLGDRKCTFHVNLLRKCKRRTYASFSPSGNLDDVDNACSNQAVASAVSLCDPSVFPFVSVSSVETSLSVDIVVDKELHPHRDSDLPFCETICFAKPTAYVSAISEEDGDMQETFVVRSDAPDLDIGAVLLQDRGGTLMPCQYASRKLFPREGRYSAIEREALALIFAVTQFRRHLAFNHFILQTDHKSLSYLRAGSLKNARLMRWALALQEFSFQVVHIAGFENVHADVENATLIIV